MTTNGQRRPFTITCVQRSDAGYWTARVTSDGTTVDVDRRFGSWQADVRVRPDARTFQRRDVLPHIAKALQDRVRPLERA